jgi:hypothetical protein
MTGLGPSAKLEKKNEIKNLKKLTLKCEMIGAKKSDGNCSVPLSLRNNDIQGLILVRRLVPVGYLSTVLNNVNSLEFACVTNLAFVKLTDLLR